MQRVPKTTVVIKEIEEMDKQRDRDNLKLKKCKGSRKPLLLELHATKHKNVTDDGRDTSSATIFNEVHILVEENVVVRIIL